MHPQATPLAQQIPPAVRHSQATRPVAEEPGAGPAIPAVTDGAPTMTTTMTFEAVVAEQSLPEVVRIRIARAADGAVPIAVGLRRTPRKIDQLLRDPTSPVVNPRGVGTGTPVEERTMEKCDAGAICRQNRSPSRRTVPTRGDRSLPVQWNKANSVGSSSGATRTMHRSQDHPRVVGADKVDLHLRHRRIVLVGVDHPRPVGDEPTTMGSRRVPVRGEEIVRRQHGNAGSAGRKVTPRPSVHSGVIVIFERFMVSVNR